MQHVVYDRQLKPGTPKRKREKKAANIAAAFPGAIVEIVQEWPAANGSPAVHRIVATIPKEKPKA